MTGRSRLRTSRPGSSSGFQRDSIAALLNHWTRRTRPSGDWTSGVSGGFELEGWSIFVTGGSTGIGRASATALAREGARVTIADVNETDALSVVGEIQGGGGQARF